METKINDIAHMSDTEFEEMYGDLLEEAEEEKNQELDEMHELCASIYEPEDFEEEGGEEEIEEEEIDEVDDEHFVNVCEWS